MFFICFVGPVTSESRAYARRPLDGGSSSKLLTRKNNSNDPTIPSFDRHMSLVEMLVDDESTHRTIALETERSNTPDNFETMSVRKNCTPRSLDRRRSALRVHCTPFTTHDTKATLAAANHTLRETRQETISAPIPLQERLIIVDSLEAEEVECKLLLHPMSAQVVDLLTMQVFDLTQISRSRKHVFE